MSNPLVIPSAETGTLEAEPCLESAQGQFQILQSVLDGMGEGLVVADATGTMTFFNPAAERIWVSAPRRLLPGEWAAHFGLFLPDRVTPYPEAEIPLVRAVRGEIVDGAELFVRHAGIPEGLWLTVTAVPCVTRKGTPGAAWPYSATSRRAKPRRSSSGT